MMDKSRCLGGTYQLPHYYHAVNLPAQDLYQLFIFRASVWDQVEAMVRGVFADNAGVPIRVVKIHTETGVCDNLVSQCVDLIHDHCAEIEVEIKGGFSLYGLGFAIGSLNRTVQFHYNLRN